MARVLSFAAGLSFAVLTISPLLAANGDPLARYRDGSRVLVVVAPAATDQRLIQQRRLFEAMKAGAGERDLVLVEAIGPSKAGRALRERFDIAPSDFRALLIGKDGGEKLSSSTPLGSEQLFPLIDSMPMRQDEMRRKDS